MKFAIVFFTYVNDAELLGLALRGVERLRRLNPGDEFDVFVRDDACAPLEVVPEGVQYTQTHFNRCRNLNGLECISGMLAEYAAIFEQGDYDWLIKADCDTYINDVEWLRKHDAGLVLHVGTNHVHDYNSGACYALSAAGVQQIRSFMGSESVVRRVARAWCEDKAICRMAVICGNAVVMDNAANNIKAGLLYHDWKGEYAATLEDLKLPYAVDFKRCMWHSTPEAFEEDRAKAVARMAEYAAYVENELN